MIPRIKTFVTLDNYRLLVTFDDGRVVEYDVSDDIREIPSFKDLATIFGLFRNAQLDTSRTCIFWNDQIDLPSDTIYEYGTEVFDQLYVAEDTPAYNGEPYVP